MLSNTEIRNLTITNHLITSFVEDGLKHCSYKLRVGKLIKPGGSIIYDSDRSCDLNWVQKCLQQIAAKILPNGVIQDSPNFNMVNGTYELKPNELIIFQTMENVRIPLHLSAYYSALDSISKKGLLLINASVVEPGYVGPLSGVLLNFSSRSFMIRPQMEIVKIIFHQVDGIVDCKVNENAGNDYTEKLLEKAQNYTQTFLDVERIKEDVINQTSKKVSKSIKLGGWFLALLLAFCTIEPVLYKYIWYDSWVPINSSYVELERAYQYQKQMNVIDSLSKKIDSLKVKIENQNAIQSNPKPKGRL